MKIPVAFAVKIAIVLTALLVTPSIAFANHIDFHIVLDVANGGGCCGPVGFGVNVGDPIQGYVGWDDGGTNAYFSFIIGGFVFSGPAFVASGASQTPSIEFSLRSPIPTIGADARLLMAVDASTYASFGCHQGALCIPTLPLSPFPTSGIVLEIRSPGSFFTPIDIPFDPPGNSMYYLNAAGHPPLQPTPTPTPEPTSWVLLATGVVAIWLRRSRMVTQARRASSR